MAIVFLSEHFIASAPVVNSDDIMVVARRTLRHGTTENINTILQGQAGRRHGSLASMSLCKYRSSAHLLKLTRNLVKLSARLLVKLVKLVCDVARLVSIMITRDDVISDVIRPRSTIREDHIDTPYREILC